jgi:hypothetical protein
MADPFTAIDLETIGQRQDRSNGRFCWHGQLLQYTFSFVASEG